MQKNFFKTNFSKNVLISQLIIPPHKKLHHTNTTECLGIANAFKRLGYNVDVINNNSDKNIDFSKYEIVFGSGKPLVRSFYEKGKNIVRFFYGPGMHPYVCNKNTLKRTSDFYKKTGKLLLESSRYISEDYLLQTSMVDGLVVMGDDVTIQSYRNFFDGEILKLPPFFYKVHDFEKIINNKNFSEAKKNFIFFSGSGMIHKGLDLLIETFSKNKSIHLHICSPVENEPGFKNYYKKELDGSPNIHNHGFVNIESGTFQKLIEQCAFVIFPSCSEGGGVSAIMLMGNGGLIPIATKEASIEIEKNGIKIKELSVESVGESVTEALKLSEEQIYVRSLEIGQRINNVNTFENYVEKLGSYLKKILKIK